jgi:hypothetical protein
MAAIFLCNKMKFLSVVVFEALMLCGLVLRYQRFGGKYCLHLQQMYTALQPRRPTLYLLPRRENLTTHNMKFLKLKFQTFAFRHHSKMKLEI